MFKVLIQIQQQAINSEKALRTVRLQQNSKEREKKLNSLTRIELESVPNDGEGGLYNGVGKMFVSVDRDELMKKLSNDEKSLNEDINALNKKFKYLEKELINAQSNLKDIFQSNQS